MLIDTYASLPHYAAHLAPIWKLLVERGVAGHAWAPRTGCWWGAPLRHRPDPSRPVLVAGYADNQRVSPACTVLVEHGAGQTYRGTDSGSYSGGAGWDRAILFLAPSEAVAERWRTRYDAPAVAVGAPKLDQRHRSGFRIPESGILTVAVTFHWDCRLVPETRSAWRHYDRSLPGLVEWANANGIRLLGHGHPRLWGRIERRWRRLGVEPVADLDDVFDRADLLVADNTSAMFEFASLGRPVVVLNAPWYRRDVEHGGRFWSWADVGVQVNEPDELPGAITVAAADPPRVAASRARVVGEVYAACDGHAAARAAAAIEKVLADA